jgi:PAS domain S-box-containing protein
VTVIRKQDTTTLTRYQVLTDMQLVLETTGVGVWTYDAATDRFDMDETCLEILELQPGETATYEVLASKLHPDDLDRYRDAVHETLRTGRFEVECRLVRRDGTIRFMSGRGYALPNRSERSAPVIKGVFIDVSDRKRLENELRDTEARMQHLADGIPGLFAYIDWNYMIRFMSAKYREIFNRSAAELINRHVREVFGEQEFLARKPRYDRALAGETVRCDAERLMPDGTRGFFAVTYQPFRDASGEIQGVICLAADITDRHQMEQRLEQQARELARSNADLEQFAYVASHDLKAPLRAIEVLVEWLREDLAEHDAGEVQENLRLLKRRTGRLNKLLDDLLAYSRAGRNMGEIAAIETRAMVADIAVLLAPPDGMSVIADDSLPEIIAHHAPLEQVLRNLINNAIKHHPTGNGRVTVSADERDDSVLFAVADDGAGIPEAYAEKVFQMFQTLQPRDERESSGMGLAIVKRIIDWQGGRIWFHPGPAGQGTVFKFTWNKLDPTSFDTDEGHAYRQYSAG